MYLHTRPWGDVIQDCDKGSTMTFLQHICRVDRVRKQSSLKSYFKQFRQLYNLKNGRLMDTNDAKEGLAVYMSFVDSVLNVTNSIQYILGPLTEEFKLERTEKVKPELGIDDLMILLHFHWARDTNTYPTERQRLQFALCFLLLFMTGCRPAELVDGGKQDKKKAKNTFQQVLDGDSPPANKRPKKKTKNTSQQVFDGDSPSASSAQKEKTTDKNQEYDDSAYRPWGIKEGDPENDSNLFLEESDDRPNALCYEDIRLMVVRNPNEGGRKNVITMEIKLSHHKGADRTLKP